MGRGDQEPGHSRAGVRGAAYGATSPINAHIVVAATQSQRALITRFIQRNARTPSHRITDKRCRGTVNATAAK
jgi:hypothetical protein